MRRSRRVILRTWTAGLAVLAGAPLRASGPLGAAAVHVELAAGNSRFCAGRPRHPHSSRKWLERAARTGQHPHAIVLCCSDSRVAPEILFDQGIGDLFVVRVAGNVLREDELGSIEYAVEHLRVPLCLVLGRSGCGAVAAVIEGEHLPTEVDHLVDPIRLALAEVQARGGKPAREALIAGTVREHARQTRESLKASPGLQGAVRARRLQVEAAVCDMATGRLAWI